MSTLGRRDVLRGAAYALTLLVPLGACKRVRPFTCTKVDGLTEEERTVRTTLEYVDHTPLAGKTCITCIQWTDAPEDGVCGGCKVMKGPIHPDGYCKVFAPKG